MISYDFMMCGTPDIFIEHGGNITCNKTGNYTKTVRWTVTMVAINILLDSQRKIILGYLGENHKKLGYFRRI